MTLDTRTIVAALGGLGMLVGIGGGSAFFVSATEAAARAELAAEKVRVELATCEARLESCGPALDQCSAALDTITGGHRGP